MQLTTEERDRIIREVEALEGYGSVTIEVCGPRGRIDIMVERRVRIRDKPQDVDRGRTMR